MPSRLRPSGPIAADAILVGDPGRALLLAQDLLQRPRMVNHARGLWGYGGRTPAGRALTIQSTGMGGPSAAIVLADLTKLGLRRAVRVGTCVGLDERARLGELLLVEQALAVGGSSAAFGLPPSTAVRPDAELLAGLDRELGDGGRATTVASFDELPPADAGGVAAVADMQTVAVLARGGQAGVAVGALLVVSETREGRLDDEALEDAAKAAGRCAAEALSHPKL